eukprot:1130795-Amphidinium_carterae.1
MSEEFLKYQILIVWLGLVTCGVQVWCQFLPASTHTALAPQRLEVSHIWRAPCLPAGQHMT